MGVAILKKCGEMLYFAGIVAHLLDFLKKYNLRFPEGKTYEDNPFNLAAFFLTDRINFLQYEGYYQLVHLDSITTCKIKQNEVPYSELEQSA